MSKEKIPDNNSGNRSPSITSTTGTLPPDQNVFNPDRDLGNNTEACTNGEEEDHDIEKQGPVAPSSTLLDPPDYIESLTDFLRKVASRLTTSSPSKEPVFGSMSDSKENEEENEEITTNKQSVNFGTVQIDDENEGSVFDVSPTKPKVKSSAGEGPGRQRARTLGHIFGEPKEGLGDEMSKTISSKVRSLQEGHEKDRLQPFKRMFTQATDFITKKVDQDKIFHNVRGNNLQKTIQQDKARLHDHGGGHDKEEEKPEKAKKMLKRRATMELGNVSPSLPHTPAFPGSPDEPGSPHEKNASPSARGSLRVSESAPLSRKSRVQPPPDSIEKEIVGTGSMNFKSLHGATPVNNSRKSHKLHNEEFQGFSDEKQESDLKDEKAGDTGGTGFVLQESGSFKPSVFQPKLDTLFQSQEPESLPSDDIEEVVDDIRRDLLDEFPIPMVIFFGILAVIAGVVSAVVHYIFITTRCPIEYNKYTCKKEYGGGSVRYYFEDIIGKEHTNIIYLTYSFPLIVVFALWIRFLPSSYKPYVNGGGAGMCLLSIASGIRIPWEGGLLRIIASGIYLGLGTPLGSEAPILFICTSVATQISYTVGVRSPAVMSIAATIGSSVGLSTAFNAPVAGSVYVIEELTSITVLPVSRKLCSLVMLVSPCSVLVARLILGDIRILANYKTLMYPMDVNYQTLPLLCVPLALLNGFASALLTKLVLKCRAWLRGKYEIIGGKEYAFVWIMLIVYILSFGFSKWNGIESTGTEAGLSFISQLYSQDHEFLEVVCFYLVQMSLIIVCVSVDAPGGVMVPTLVLGANVGFLYGNLVYYLFGLTGMLNYDLEQKLVAYFVTFGMVGHFGATYRFSLTPVVIVIEATRSFNVQMILPCIITAALSTHIAQLLGYASLIDELLAQDGIDLSDQQLIEEAPQYDDTLESDPFGNSLGLIGEETVYDEGLGERDDAEKPPARTASTQAGRRRPSLHKANSLLFGEYLERAIIGAGSGDTKKKSTTDAGAFSIKDNESTNFDTNSSLPSRSFSAMYGQQPSLGRVSKKHDSLAGTFDPNRPARPESVTGNSESSFVRHQSRIETGVGAFFSSPSLKGPGSNSNRLFSNLPGGQSQLTNLSNLTNNNSSLTTLPTINSNIIPHSLPRKDINKNEYGRRDSHTDSCNSSLNNSLLNETKNLDRKSSFVAERSQSLMVGSSLDKLNFMKNLHKNIQNNNSFTTTMNNKGLLGNNSFTNSGLKRPSSRTTGGGGTGGRSVRPNTKQKNNAIDELNTLRRCESTTPGNSRLKRRSSESMIPSASQLSALTMDK